jgi:hypothetical protein
VLLRRTPPADIKTKRPEGPFEKSFSIEQALIPFSRIRRMTVGRFAAFFLEVVNMVTTFLVVSLSKNSVGNNERLAHRGFQGI